jgi:hypothetical protein
MKTKKKKNLLKDSRSPRLRRHSIKKEMKEVLISNRLDLKRRPQLLPKRDKKKEAPKVQDLRASLRLPQKKERNRRKRKRLRMMPKPTSQAMIPKRIRHDLLTIL